MFDQLVPLAEVQKFIGIVEMLFLDGLLDQLANGDLERRHLNVPTVLADLNFLIEDIEHDV